MNDLQQKALELVTKAVKEENIDTVKALLTESFTKQDSGSFTLEDAQGFASKLLPYIKTEKLPEVMSFMQEFQKKIFG